MSGFSRDEKKNFMRDKIRSCVVPVSVEKKELVAPKNFSYLWIVGTNEQVCVKGVCRIAFCKAYGIGHTLLETLCAEVKQGVKMTEQVNRYIKVILNFNYVVNLLF